MPIDRITDSGRPVTDEDIARVEARFGCTLPAPYVAFLRQHNGGMPEPNEFVGIDPRDVARVDFFFIIEGDDKMNLIEEAAFFREYHDVPKSLLPIARTPMGDIICIGIGQKVHGAVFFWSHDHPVRDEAARLLAHDLDAFLATFREVER